MTKKYRKIKEIWPLKRLLPLPNGQFTHDLGFFLFPIAGLHTFSASSVWIYISPFFFWGEVGENKQAEEE